jgi:hypothetical protein
LHVQRLHRGGDARGGEAGQVVVLQRLDVLDPVAQAGRGADGRVGVERGAHGAVAGGVGGALEAGAREQRDRAGVAVGVGPERQRPVALRVRRVEPAGAGVDHAVDELCRRLSYADQAHLTL